MAIAVSSVPPVKPRGLALIFGWRRVRFTLIVATLFGLMLSAGSQAPTYIVLSRALIVGLSVLFMYGLFEQWPQRTPKWLARWVLQLIGIFIVVPFAALFAYYVTTGGHPDFANNKLRTHREYDCLRL